MAEAAGGGPRRDATGRRSVELATARVCWGWPRKREEPGAGGGWAWVGMGGHGWAWVGTPMSYEAAPSLGAASHVLRHKPHLASVPGETEVGVI